MKQPACTPGPGSYDITQPTKYVSKSSPSVNIQKSTYSPFAQISNLYKNYKVNIPSAAPGPQHYKIQNPQTTIPRKFSDQLSRPEIKSDPMMSPLKYRIPEQKYIGHKFRRESVPYQFKNENPGPDAYDKNSSFDQMVANNNLIQRGWRLFQ
ncbi:Sperm-tail_PG-rich repeat [Hexamita inflata]|uniref:Sperm-tail PG-rich repeat n=1 Tax=Hexamita inflata TaxID=28002 RepID=A0AA86UTW4_9EUKA|nr:Sperm-tail PG-rich repeat [Hexamita inflata]